MQGTDMKHVALASALCCAFVPSEGFTQEDQISCDLRVDGRQILKGTSCYMSVAAGSYEFDQGNFLSIRIDNSTVFRWNGSNPPAKSPDDPNRFRLKSLGRVKAQTSDKGVCWDNARVHFCYSRQ